MRGDHSFEDQFQWEADRLVFRHLHRGDPVEVSREERDRLVERHRERMAFGSRVAGLGILVSVALCVTWPRQAYFVPMVFGAGFIIGMPLLSHWAFNDVTAHLRRRQPIGLRLGFAGRLARKANALGWRELWGSIAYLALVSAMMIWSLDVRTPSGMGLIAVVAAIGLLLFWMVLAKWTQRERSLIHDEKIDSIRRARHLRD